MKIALVVLVVVSSGLAAPVDDVAGPQKSSSYGAEALLPPPPPPPPPVPVPAPLAPAPCAGALPYGPVSVYFAPQAAPAPQPHAYQPPPHSYQPPPYQPPQYREEDYMQEEMNPSARSYYDSAPSGPLALNLGGYASGGASAGIAAGAGTASAGHAGAVGLFPNAKVGGCNVPILLSCSPNVVAGHLSAPQSYSPAYRNHEEDTHTKTKTGWGEERTASHHKVSVDYPDINASNHHVVSKDYPVPNLTRIVAHRVNQENDKTNDKQSEKKVN